MLLHCQLQVRGHHIVWPRVSPRVFELDAVRVIGRPCARIGEQQFMDGGGGGGRRACYKRLQLQTKSGSSGGGGASDAGGRDC